jgi:uroporphyrin-III C-methyltransferase
MADAPAPREEATPAPSPSGARPRRGAASAALFVLWLLTLGGAGAAGWRYVYLPLHSRLMDAEAGLVRLRGDLEALTQRQGGLAGRLGAHDAVLAALQDSLARIEARTAGRESAWRAAEAEHLLRLAAVSARLREDPALADAALAGADRALAAGAEPAWVPVREAIAQARASLAAVQKVDTVGIRLELRALADELAHAPLLGGPEARPAPAGAPPGWWARLRALARDLFVVRRVAGDQVIGAQAGAFVRAEMRARFALTELALDRRDGAGFRLQVNALRNLVHAHFDPKAAAVSAALEALDRYAALEVAPGLPDLGEPLARLEAARAARTPEQRP